MTADEWERNATGVDRMPPAPETARSGDATAALLREVIAGQKRIEATLAKHGGMLMRLGLRTKAVDERTEQMATRIAAMDGRIGKTPAASGEPAKMTTTDRDLDGQYGNPIVKSDPKGWQGDSYKGHRYSDCPADYLRALAEQIDKFAQFGMRDAARARGWAERNKDRATSAAKQETPPTTTEANDWD